MTIEDYIYYYEYVTNLNEFRNNSIKRLNYARLVKLDKEIVYWRNRLKESTKVKLINK